MMGTVSNRMMFLNKIHPARLVFWLIYSVFTFYYLKIGGNFRKITIMKKKNTSNILQQMDRRHVNNNKRAAVYILYTYVTLQHVGI